MKKHQKPQKRGTRDKTVKTASVLFLTLVFALMLSGAASAGTPLAENQTGTVSGDLYVNTTDGWPSSTQGATNEVTQANTLPAYTSIDSAKVYVNVYSGSGSNNWPVRTTIKLDGNGDGDYDDPGETLGVEDMNIPGSPDGTVYWLNDHCNRVYSDYQVWYNVTNLITCNNPTLYVKTENMGGDGYDGRIKLLSLVMAYNDGDTDQVHYWVLNGQDWINTDNSPSSSTFNTSSLNGQVSSATLNTVALASTDGNYNINGTAISGNLTETGSYYKENQWDVTSNITPGQNTTLTYTNIGSSLKMNLATLAVRLTAPVANFTSDKTTGTAPFTVQFTDTSTNVTGWTWDFNNDGLIDSTLQNPTYIYSNRGSYTVNLTVTGPGGTDTETKTNYITVGPNVNTSLAGGTYTTDQTVTLTSDDPTATIYYANDKTDPRTSGTRITYTGPITISNTTTLRYAAISTDGNWSPLYLQNYVIGNSGLADTVWPKAHGDTSNTGQSEYNGPQTNATIWNYTTGGYLYYGSPAIAADGTIYIGSYDKNLYAINPDGTLKWKYNIGATSIYSFSPAIGADGTIYIGAGQQLYAINPDGTLKWRCTGTGAGGSVSTAIAADGTLYMGEANGTFFAITPNGTVKWTYNLRTDPNLAVTIGSYGCSPAIGSDGTIYVGDSNSYGNSSLFAFNPDGTLKWKYDTGGNGNNIYAAPAIGPDGTIYFGSRNRNFYALNPDGTLKWTYTAETEIRSTPSIATDGSIYFGDYNGKIYALNPDGTLKWTYTAGGRTYGLTIGADGIIYFGGYDNKIYALNPNGTLQWTFTTGNYIYGTPAIASDGTLYIGSRDGKLYALKDAFAPVANFTSSITNGTEGYVPITMQFTDTSTYPASWLWDFGDGTTSTEKNPLHTYSIPGTYAVSLTVTNAAGNNTIVQNVVLNMPSVPVANFTADNVSGMGHLTVHFTDQSTGVNLSRVWDFNGDGITDSTEMNPTFTYTTVGNYTVKLTVSNIAGSSDEVKTDYISVLADTEAPTVVASPISTNFNPPMQVTLSATDNADLNPQIYYTTDNTDPTISSTLYTGPINLIVNTTLKFIAVDVSGNISPVHTETYTMVDTEAPNVTATQNGTNITISATDNSDPNPAIYYTTNGDEPTTGSTPYSGPFTIPPAAITVVKFLALDTSGNTSPVQSRSFNTTRSTDLLTGYYAEGNVGVIISNGGTGYTWFAHNTPGTGTVTYTASNLNIPTGATILSARLYQAWTWYGYPGYTLQFNGQNVPVTVHYPDGNDGQDVFDVTPYFNANGDNTAVLTSGGGASYGTILIVVYQSASEPYRKIWVNEGFDIIPGYSNYGATEGPGHAYFNNVTNTNIGTAQIITLLPSGDNDSPNILLNGQTFTISSTGGSDPAYKYYNINPAALQNGTNILEVPNGGYMSISNAILTLTMPPADLAISDIQTSDPQVGTSSPVTATITNNGGTDASNFLVKLYDNNIQVVKTNITSLAAGASLPISFDWTPSTTGNHVLAIITDAGSQITESDENNNLVSAEVTVNPSAQPDLIATNLMLPVSPVIGTTSPVTVTITNQGAVDSSAFVVKLYDNNIQYATINLTGLAAGTSTDVIFDWLTYTTGQHNLSVIADANQQITEYNENNNQLSQQATVSQSTLPDLTMTNLQAPNSPVVAVNSQVTATVTNLGTVDSGAFVVKLYDNNTQIAKINLTGLAAGASTDVTFNWSTLTSGAHNLSVIADANQQITEYNENNNQISQQATVNPSAQPDLTVTDLQLPANPVAGTTYQITVTVTNLGTVDTTAFAVKLYDNNTQLGKINLTSLSAGTSTQVTFNWTPPTGTHNMAIKADTNNQITEYNENNNQITQQATAN